MTWPSNLPEWATDGTQIAEPLAGQKASGWNPEQKPPNQIENWIDNTSYENLREARAMLEPFESCVEFIAGRENDGELGFVDTDTSDTRNAGPYELHGSAVALAGASSALCMDGEFVYYSDGTTVKQSPIDDLATTTQTFTLTNQGTATGGFQMATNGVVLVVSYDGGIGNYYSDIIRIDTGAVVAALTLSSTGYCVCGNEHSYICDVSNVTRYKNSTGAAFGTYDHSAVITSINISRGRIFLSGAPRTTTVGNATTGDTVEEITDSGTPVCVWGSQEIATAILTNNMSCDGDDLFVLYASGGNEGYVHRLSMFYGLDMSGSTQVVKTPAGSLFGRARVDQDWLIIPTSLQEVLVVDKKNLSPMGLIPSIGTTGTPLIATDGDSLMVIYNDFPTHRIARYRKTSSRPRKYRRVITELGGGGPKDLPWYHAKAIPAEGIQ